MQLCQLALNVGQNLLAELASVQDGSEAAIAALVEGEDESEQGRPRLRSDLLVEFDRPSQGRPGPVQVVEQEIVVGPAQ